MTPETSIILNIGVGPMLTGIAGIFVALLAIVWKGKKEISDTIREELGLFRKAGKEESASLREELRSFRKDGKEEAASLRDELGAFRKTVAGIVNAVNEIQIILKNKFDGLQITHNLIERGGSPLRPTEYGAQLIKDSGLEKILDDNKDFLRTKLKASLPKEYTEYDVQEHSRKLLLDLENDPVLNPVKEWVYKNPIDIKTILRVGGLWLRDDFLKQPRKVSPNTAKEEEEKE